MKNAFSFETEIGKLSLCQENNVITKLYFNNNARLILPIIKLPY